MYLVRIFVNFKSQYDNQGMRTYNFGKSKGTENKRNFLVLMNLL